ncbi:hypothetical protein E2C01_092998 [Portunus trituberculatus]|uniref:Uncharacterized protein n=1 Tax=Portunus trituberculatus TaxID=210409 RepID=A0A5B7JZE8_PORTR|nr:hypothetical protein [Portunus trituberculatus]
MHEHQEPPAQLANQPQILSAKIDRNTEGREEGNLLLCNYTWIPKYKWEGVTETKRWKTLSPKSPKP